MSYYLVPDGRTVIKKAGDNGCWEEGEKGEALHVVGDNTMCVIIAIMENSLEALQMIQKKSWQDSFIV